VVALDLLGWGLWASTPCLRILKTSESWLEIRKGYGGAVANLAQGI
jgi:hypothetical protein